MDIPVTAEIQEDNIYSPSKRPRMESEIKAQIEADIKPKFEADIKIKIEPVEEFNRSMEIIKGGLISESFSLRLKSPNKDAKSLSAAQKGKCSGD